MTDSPAKCRTMTDPPAKCRIMTDPPAKCRIMTDPPAKYRIMTEQPAKCRIMTDPPAKCRTMTDLSKGGWESIGISLSVHMSCKRNSSLLDQLMLINLYSASVYDLRMCMKEDNSGPNYLKGDN